MTKLNPSQLVLRGLMHLGFSHEQLATILAKPATFVEEVAQGGEQWRPGQLRRLAAAARLPAERIALLGIDRARLTRSERQFVRETESLIDTLEAATLGSVKSKKRVSV